MDTERIVIRQFIDEDGDLVHSVEVENCREDGPDEPPALVTLLGMLRLAESTIMDEYMNGGED